jgi:Leucine-rich repeat (LRR) protein
MENFLIYLGINLQDINNITDIIIPENINFITIPSLKNFNNLKTFVCINNNLSIIPEMPENIEEIKIVHNNIKHINNISHLKHLKFLKISYNKIKTIPNLEKCINFLSDFAPR